MNSTQKTRFDSGLCVDCGNRREDKNKQKCLTCRVKISRKTKLYFSERNKLGLCGRCGINPATIYKKKRICIDCWMKDLARRSLGNMNMYCKIRDLFYKQDRKCAYTGEELIPGVNASLDHIVPVCYGGTNEISNLQWVTRKQNVQKNRLSDEQYREKLANGTKENARRATRMKRVGNTRMIAIRILEEEYNDLYAEYKRSCLSWSDFIMRNVYHYKNCTNKESKGHKRNSSR